MLPIQIQPSVVQIPKEIKRAHLANISKLTQGFIADYDWQTLRMMYKWMPKMSVPRTANLINITVPKTTPLSPEEVIALKAKRKALHEKCLGLKDKIWEAFYSGTTNLIEQHKLLKATQDEWLECRFRLKPEKVNDTCILSFTVLQLVAKTGLRLAKSHQKMERLLGMGVSKLEPVDDALFYVTKKDNTPMRFLVIPQGRAKSLARSDFLKEMQDVVDAGGLDQAVQTGPGIVTRDLNHKNGPLPVLLCRFYSPEQLAEMLTKGIVHLVEDHLCNLSSLEKDEDNRENLGTYILNYRSVLVEMLFRQLSCFTKDQCDELFLKSLQSPVAPLLANSIFPYISLSLPVREAAFDYAVKTRNAKWISEILSLYPDVYLKSPNTADLFWAIENGLNTYVLRLLDAGLSANACVKEFTVTTYFTCNTTLGSLVKWAESEPHDSEAFIKLANILITKGADPNQLMSSDCYSEYHCTVLERCYFNRKNPRCAQLFDLLLNSRAKITPRLAQSMLLEIEATGTNDYLGYLIVQNYISKENGLLLVQKTTQHPTQKQHLIRQTLEAIEYLQKAVVRFHLNYVDLDLNKISQIRLLKRQLKNYIKANPDEALSLQTSYKILSETYDRIVDNHILLSELRDISREIRDLEKPENEDRAFSWRTIRFYGLQSPDKAYILNDANARVRNLLGKTRKVYWENMREKVISSGLRVFSDSYLRKHFITWIHGTRSISLPPMLKTRQLESLGQMLSKNMVTFSGEVCGSDKSLNKNKISGERLTLSWGEGLIQYYDSVSRSHTCKLYADYSRGYRPDENVFVPDIAWERASTNHVKKLLAISEEGYSHGLWTVVQLDILRLRSTDASADQKLQELKEYIKVMLASPLEQIYINELTDLLKTLNDPIPVFFDEKDLKMIMDKNPYGIVLGSTTAYSTPERYPESYQDPYEFVVEGSLTFKKEIQVAFAPQNRVEELKKLLSPLGLRIYDYETLSFMEMMQMIRGTRHRTLAASLKEKPEVFRNQKMISLSLQQDVLPCYAMPFPKNPKYRDEGTNKMRLIDKPYFAPSCTEHDDYMLKVSEGKELARTIHGTMHSTRASIWSQLVHNLYHKLTAVNKSDAYLLAISAAAHDIARQDEGQDFWDRSSSKWLRGYLLSLGYNKDTIEAYVHALAEKDPENRQFTTLVQKCVHDADCLEIMRLPWYRSNFRKDELCFYRELKGQGIDLDKLIAEVEDFIVQTEEFGFKKSIEENSQDGYGDTMKLMANAHEKTGRYPTIFALMKDELEACKV